MQKMRGIKNDSVQTSTKLSDYINPRVSSIQLQNAKNGQAKGVQNKPVKSENYKTVMCQSWLSSMSCAFGEKCKFAHGEHEIRPTNPPIRNPSKYKTQLCYKYTSSGICPYGSRCLFIHPEPEKAVVVPSSIPSIRKIWPKKVGTPKRQNLSIKSGLQRPPRVSPSPAKNLGKNEAKEKSHLFNQSAEAIVSFLWKDV